MVSVKSYNKVNESSRNSSSYNDISSFHIQQNKKDKNNKNKTKNRVNDFLIKNLPIKF